MIIDDYIVIVYSQVMFLKRALDLTDVVKKKSCFLFGPRQTGKTSLIKNTLLTKNSLSFSLLDSEIYLALSQSPKLIEQRLTASTNLVVIDEIQKMPSLLDEVHRLIEDRNICFLLTGSSARKLRRGGVNLLGGRARSRYLHPFIAREIPDFDLMKALNYGLLPSIYFSDSPGEDLRAYVGDYLKEEIHAEGLIRSLPAFSRFLEVAGLSSGQMLNFSDMASDAQVKRTTLHEYFSILQDTLLANELPSFQETRTRKAISTSKFYFFDIGVVRSLRGSGPLRLKSPDLGDAFEHYIFHELKSYLDYHNKEGLSYWRSLSQFEVDFILCNQTAIEVEAKTVVPLRDLRGLRALKEEDILKRYIVVTFEKARRKVDGIELIPWTEFLSELWEGRFG